MNKIIVTRYDQSIPTYKGLLKLVLNLCCRVLRIQQTPHFKQTSNRVAYFSNTLSSTNSYNSLN